MLLAVAPTTAVRALEASDHFEFAPQPPWHG
jgi:hypothetical protein